jgi:hypothetical protein
MIAEVQDGLEARKIERMIAARSDISDAVHHTRKQGNITVRLPPEAVNERVLELMDHINIDMLQQNPEIFDLSSYYGFDTPPSDPLRWPEDNEPIDNSVLDGEIYGVKGSNILVERESILFVADLRRLLGYNIGQEKYPTRTVKQSGLEHFL